MKGIGIDIVEISRIKQAVQDFGQRFLEKIFTPREINYCSTPSTYRFPQLAARFAAKEAYAKALGQGLKGVGSDKNAFDWREIEVVNHPSGQPFIQVKGQKQENVLLSLSHGQEYAVASVYVEE